MEMHSFYYIALTPILSEDKTSKTKPSWVIKNIMICDLVEMITETDHLYSFAQLNEHNTEPWGKEKNT